MWLDGLGLVELYFNVYSLEDGFVVFIEVVVMEGCSIVVIVEVLRLVF